MKITYNWLKDFVEIDITPQRLSEKLTMAGLEVVSLERRGDDWVLELEITSNRADCLSVMGIAREISAITQKKLKIRDERSKPEETKKENLKIEIEERSDCPLYTARLIRDTKVKPSPKWLKKRLESIGVRCVNNIVDVTNYVLLEAAQPLHAFDYDKLKERIVVRRARRGEKIITLDGVERELNPDILVISDSKSPVAIAGVMGSRDTEVTENTKNILLESAEFNPLVVRKTRRYFGLQTESAYRFERGVDRYNVIFSSQRAQDLIREIAKGKPESFRIEGRFKEKERVIFLKPENIEKILGEEVPSSKTKKILKSLQFKIREEKAKLRVSVPSFRKDIKEEIDLIEELGRIYGYDNINSSLPYIKVALPETLTQDKIKDRVKSQLLKLGLSEVITYSLIDPNYLKEKEIVKIENPPSKDFSVLRPNLLFSLLKVLGYNTNRGADYTGIFELAKVYKYRKDNLPAEEDVLGILVAGNFYSDWLRNQRFSYNFFDLKGIIETILRDLGIKDYEFKDREIPYLAESAGFDIKGNTIGFLGKADTNLLERFEIKIKSDVYFSQIHLEGLKDFVDLEKEFKAIPLFPSIKRDISLIVKKDVSCKQIFDLIREKGGELLSSVALFDQYKGASIPKDYVGLAFSLEYRSNQRTLTTEEVDSLHRDILGNLQKRLDVKIR